MPPFEVESIWFEPPGFRPPPVVLPWAPPPMLVQEVPPAPFHGAVWIGGYWIWQRGWVWAHGIWSAPPRPGLRWMQPSYEHRLGSVLFVTGYWSDALPNCAPQGVVGLGAKPAPGTPAGSPAIGPEGSFLPPPPGSRRGIIVPAPFGSAPAVVTSAPPVVAPGMRVRRCTATGEVGTRLNIVAPSSSTACGRPVDLYVPTQAHLAASLPSVVRAMAPKPRSELTVRYIAAAEIPFLRAQTMWKPHGSRRGVSAGQREDALADG